MSNSDVQVKFSASIAGVTAAVGEVKNSLQGLGAHAKTANDNLKGIGGETKAALGIAGSAVTDLRYALEGISSPIKGIRKNLGELAAAFVAAFAVDKIAHLTEAMGELGLKTERTMHILGLSAPQVGELNYIAKTTGTSTQELAMGVERFQRNLAQAMTGVGPAASALHNFGLKAKDLIQLPLNQQINKFADAVSRYADGGTKLANGQALMSRAFANMLPVLDRGSVELDKLRAIAVRTGSVMSNDTAEAFARTQEHVDELQSSIQGLAIKFYSTFRPAIDAAVQGMAHFIESLNATKIKTFVDEVMTWFSDMALAVSKSVSSVVGWIEKLTATANAANTVFNSWSPTAMTGAFATMESRWAQIDSSTAARTASIVAHVTEAKNALGLGFGDLSGSFPSVQASMTSPAKPQMAPLNTMFGHHHAAHSGASKAARDAVTVSLDGLNREMQAIQANTRAKLTAYSSDVKNKTMTEDQKVSLTLAALAAELQAEQSLLNKEMALGGLSVSQKQAILNKKQQLEEAYAAAVAKIKQEAVAVEQKNAEATTKAWQKTWNTINNAFTGQIASLLKGTETFGQAFKNIMAGMITDVIKFLVKWALQHAETILQNVAMTAMGATAQKAINMTTIQGDAAKAAAGAYSAVTGIPIIGPILAPAAAAVAYAGTMAFASFRDGTLSLPGDQMAMVHAGETIIPPGPSADFRSIIGNLGAAVNNGGSRSGGDNHTHVHFNVNANDAGSVSSYFKSHSRQILEAINHGVRTGNHLGLSHIGG